MADKRREESSFTVTDRRSFTSEGELRADIPEEPVKEMPAKEDTAAQAAQPKSQAQKEAPPKPAPQPVAASPQAASTVDPTIPPSPSAAEQKAQAEAYRKSSKDLDARVELGGHSAKELEMTFERFLASLYMSAMMQLGLMQEEGGQPRVDLIGARQTVDTLSLIADKTKGNLTSAEENFLQNALYELRMAYVEVTNALARPPQAPGAATGTRGR